MTTNPILALIKKTLLKMWGWLTGGDAQPAEAVAGGGAAEGDKAQPSGGNR